MTRASRCSAAVIASPCSAGVIAAAVAALGLIAPAPAVAQHASAIAEERLDINGDGTLDVVRLENPPGVSIALSDDRVGSSWYPLTTAGAALVGGVITTGRGARFGGGVAIAVEAWFERPGSRTRRPSGVGSGALVHEAVVVLWRGGKLDKIWQGRVGAQGRDGEYVERIEATPEGLLRYQQRPDVRRCDGGDARLFPARYDFSQKRFRPVYQSKPAIPADAPALIASRTPPPGIATEAGGATAAVFRARTASTQAGARHAGELTAPREIDDGRAATAWREDLGGDGRGEFITVTASMREQQVAALRIVPGDAASQQAFRRANRLERAAVIIGKQWYSLEFPKDPARDSGAFDEPYWAVLPAPVTARCVTLIVADVYPGAAARGPGGGETAISELAVLTPIDLIPGGAEAELAARVARGAGGRSAGHALAARGVAGVRAVLDELAKPHDARAQAALRRVLARLVARQAQGGTYGSGRAGSGGDDVAGQKSGQMSGQMSGELAARAAVALADGLSSEVAGKGGEIDRDQLASVLVGLGPAAVPALTGVLAGDDRPAEARVLAARALAAIADETAHAALLAAVGTGPAHVRHHVAVALGDRSPAELPALLEALARARTDGASGPEADLWRAVGGMARRLAPADRGRVDDAMRARLADADGYELRYRLFATAGAHGGQAVIDALASALTATAARAARTGRTDALRRVAARALADNPLSEARTALVTLADDPDPGVRKAAIAALSQRPDFAVAAGVADPAADAGERALSRRLEADRWPEIRRLAAAGLARRCSREQPAAALVGALERDADSQVRRAALASLVTCRAPGVRARLLAVAGDRGQPTTVRVRAIALMPELEDSSLGAPLASLFASYRQRVWAGDADALELAQAAAAALGRVGGPGAAAPLLRAARDPTFPEVQAAAVIGLGALCPREARALLARLATSGEPQVAVAARRAAARCGN